MMAMIEQQPLDCNPAISSSENNMQQVSSNGINELNTNSSINLIPNATAATSLINDAATYMHPQYIFTNRFPFAAGILNSNFINDSAAAAVAISSLGQLQQQSSIGSSNASPRMGL